jgi:hypothetical protein
MIVALTGIYVGNGWMRYGHPTPQMDMVSLKDDDAESDDWENNAARWPNPLMHDDIEKRA